ncbi:hypothetical protein L1049_015217 [Liquidambar formosana]|uniref:Uncharacterized protein n=1 Tax=Liquidambar formosana TaxID=63359 RepID=A0AAP0RXR1_LIQFO
MGHFMSEKLVRPCFSVNAHFVLEWWNKRKVEFFYNKENFLVAVEGYVKENGIEALERLIAGKTLMAKSCQFMLDIAETHAQGELERF